MRIKFKMNGKNENKNKKWKTIVQRRKRKKIE